MSKSITSMLGRICKDYDLRVYKKEKFRPTAEAVGIPEEVINAPAYAVNYKDRRYIICDVDGSIENDFNLAHEIGHELLGHMDRRQDLGAEVEANIFALMMIALSLFSQYKDEGAKC